MLRDPLLYGATSVPEALHQTPWFTCSFDTENSKPDLQVPVIAETAIGPLYVFKMSQLESQL
jgi:hypothetical protein